MLMQMDEPEERYIWGTGESGMELWEKHKENDLPVDGFIDNDIHKHGMEIGGIKIYAPAFLKMKKENGVEFVVYISSMYYKEIVEQTKEMGIYDDEKFHAMPTINDWREYAEARNSWRNKLTQFEGFKNRVIAGDFSRLHSLGEDFWYFLQSKGHFKDEALRSLFPPLPGTQITVQPLEDDSLKHGFRQYLIVKKILSKHHFIIDGDKKVLDFSTGYGRVLRYLMKDFRHSNLYGVDTDQAVIEWCLNNYKLGHYTLGPKYPPVAFQERAFDLIVSCSVFTHLPQHLHRAWINELERITRSGGIVIVAIWAKPQLIKESLEIHFPDYENLIEQYQRGHYCYSNLLYKNKDDYGEAVIPINYIIENWGKVFDLIDVIVNHPYSTSQYYIVLRKKGI